MPGTHGAYGAPPFDLVRAPAGALQLSPLVVGAHAWEELAPGTLESFTMLAPPGTIERRYALAQALRALAPGGTLTALAPKDKGGSRIAKELEAFGAEVESDSKSHHKICVVRRPEVLTGVEEALLEGAPRLDAALGLWTQPGVFSWDRLDAGTAALLAQLPVFQGEGADLGAGLGVLARAVLEKSPRVSRLTLVELDRRALDCARKNVNDKRAVFLQADLRHKDTGLAGLDFLVTNPPFHDTGVEDRSLGTTFLRQAAAMLRPGGSLWLVANRHLPYEAELAALFSSSRLVAEEGGFKVVEAKR